jgi:hypothetical protein
VAGVLPENRQLDQGERAFLELDPAAPDEVGRHGTHVGLVAADEYGLGLGVLQQQGDQTVDVESRAKGLRAARRDAQHAADDLGRLDAADEGAADDGLERQVKTRDPGCSDLHTSATLVGQLTEFVAKLGFGPGVTRHPVAKESQQHQAQRSQFMRELSHSDVLATWRCDGHDPSPTPGRERGRTLAIGTLTVTQGDSEAAREPW